MLSRLTLVVFLPVLAACTLETAGLSPDAPPGARGPTPVERSCLSALAKNQEVKRDTLTITQSVSVPEGDLVTMTIAGAAGSWRCEAGLDGVARSLQYLEPAEPVAS